MIDKIYVFGKNTKIGTLLGEVQSGFNYSLTIDGTNDSAKINVISYQDIEIEPLSILYQPRTESWWIVNNDKIEKFKNENGFVYIHNLQIDGAIELFNSRDLTDCGFNANDYTISSLLQRLFKLSSFEYTINFFAIPNFLNKKVDFIKTFENYTLMSALRELLDAYNMVAKLGFYSHYISSNDTYEIDSAYLNIIPKTGDYRLPTHNITDFKDVFEIRTMHKNSFGTCVVSNAENVISSLPKTFPSVGAVRVSSNEHDIKAENAIIRLPSNVFKANWLKIVNSTAPIEVSGMIGSSQIEYSYVNSGVNALSNASYDRFLEEIKESVSSRDSIEHPTLDYPFYRPFAQALEQAKDRILQDLIKASTITLYNGNEINAFSGDIIKGANVPYLANAIFYAKHQTTNKPFIFCDKDQKNSLKTTYQGIAWERGKNIISGFDAFEPEQDRNAQIQITNFKYTDLQVDYGSDVLERYIYFSFSNQYGNIEFRTPISAYAFYFSESSVHATNPKGFCQYIVNYIPMSDIKLKVDNTRNKRDIQLYNQNGKITDNIALSKLINSYSKEISSDTITKSQSYYDLTMVPQVGSIVFTPNGDYVINNVSMTFYDNENDTYYIECEFTMSKYVSTKSANVNPNTNIRDYGIPQNFNVKRKQLYRDYYELAWETFDDANTQNAYLNWLIPFNFSTRTNKLGDLTAVMKLTYENEVEGSNAWYYQLDTVNYDLNKMFYIVLDFADNNIIGYSSQNVFSGFDISRIFSGMTDNINTPISYTDENGKVLGFDILLVDNTALTSSYNAYQLSKEGGASYKGSLFNYSIFIPSEIYDLCTLFGVKVRITEENYEKDALEVPVFEYACQIDDSNDVLIGDNILKQHDNCLYFYSYVVGENFNQNNVVNTNELTPITSPLGWQINNGVEFVNVVVGNSRLVRAKLHTRTRYEINTQEFSYSGMPTITANQDIAIFRTSHNLVTNEEIVELMLIGKKVPYDNISNNVITFEVNHYKLN